MEVRVERVTNWERAKNAARLTANKALSDKESSNKLKEDLMRAEHSPIRLVEFDIWFTDIPAFVAAHLVRHHVGTNPFQCTRREDRAEVDPREINRLTPVNLLMSCNVQALIDISRKRLCSMAHKETTKAWWMVRNAIQKIDPIVAKFMVRNCTYRGYCPEKAEDCCGYCRTMYFEEELNEYRKRYDE